MCVPERVTVPSYLHFHLFTSHGLVWGHQKPQRTTIIDESSEKMTEQREAGPADPLAHQQTGTYVAPSQRLHRGPEAGVRSRTPRGMQDSCLLFACGSWKCHVCWFEDAIPGQPEGGTESETAVRTRPQLLQLGGGTSPLSSRAEHRGPGQLHGPVASSP